MSAEWDKMQAEIEAARQVKLEVTLAKIAEANDKLFARECAAAGISPTRGVSPSLLRLLREK